MESILQLDTSVFLVQRKTAPEILQKAGRARRGEVDRSGGWVAFRLDRMRSWLAGLGEQGVGPMSLRGLLDTCEMLT